MTNLFHRQINKKIFEKSQTNDKRNVIKIFQVGTKAPLFEIAINMKLVWRF